MTDGELPTKPTRSWKPRHLNKTSLEAQQRPHLAKASTAREAGVALRVERILKPFFEVTMERTGRGPYGELVRLDFWCYPKQSAIVLGWPESYFGVEVKGFGDTDQHKKTVSRLVYQAMFYRFSTFPTLGGDWVRPDFVLLHPPLRTLIGNNDNRDKLDGFAFASAKLAGLARVGELIIDGDGFEVYFHGINIWFSSRHGRSKVDCLGSEKANASR